MEKLLRPTNNNAPKQNFHQQMNGENKSFKNSNSKPNNTYEFKFIFTETNNQNKHFPNLLGTQWWKRRVVQGGSNHTLDTTLNRFGSYPKI